MNVENLTLERAEYYYDIPEKKDKEEELMREFSWFVQEMMRLTCYEGGGAIELHTYSDYKKQLPHLEMFEYIGYVHGDEYFNSKVAAYVIAEVMRLFKDDFNSLVKRFLELGYEVIKVWKNLEGSALYRAGEECYFVICWKGGKEREGRYYEHSNLELKEVELG